LFIKISNCSTIFFTSFSKTSTYALDVYFQSFKTKAEYDLSAVIQLCPKSNKLFSFKKLTILSESLSNLSSKSLLIQFTI